MSRAISPLLNRQSGISQVGMLLTVLILGVLTYVGMQVVPFYIYYFEIEGHFEAQANLAAAKTDKEIRTYLEEQIRKMNLPVESQDLIIKRSGKNILIEMLYEEILVLDLGEDKVYDLWTFEFHPKIEKQIGR
jgi:hypothetical protein